MKKKKKNEKKKKKKKKKEEEVTTAVVLGKEEKLGRDTRPYHYIDYPATSKEAARAALFDLVRHYHRLLLLYLLLLHAS